LLPSFYASLDLIQPELAPNIAYVHPNMSQQLDMGMCSLELDGKLPHLAKDI
jgi:hypothetical protein